jgi:hypothetical protein
MPTFDVLTDENAAGLSDMATNLLKQGWNFHGDLNVVVRPS